MTPSPPSTIHKIHTRTRASARLLWVPGPPPRNQAPGRHQDAISGRRRWQPCRQTRWQRQHQPHRGQTTTNQRPQLRPSRRPGPPTRPPGVQGLGLSQRSPCGSEWHGGRGGDSVQLRFRNTTCHDLGTVTRRRNTPTRMSPSDPWAPTPEASGRLGGGGLAYLRSGLSPSLRQTWQRAESRSPLQRRPPLPPVALPPPASSSSSSKTRFVWSNFFNLLRSRALRSHLHVLLICVPGAA